MTNNVSILFVILCLVSINACKQDPPPEQVPIMLALGEVSNDYEANPYQWGFINRIGHLHIRDQFDEVRSFSEGLALVRHQGKWGYISSDGDLEIPCTHRAAWSFENGMARIQDEEGLFGFIYTSGDIAIKPKWSEASNFKGNLSCVRIGDKYGFINREGKLEIEARFDRSAYFDNNYAVVKQEGLYGMIDQKGRQVIAPKYHRLKPFKKGKARASQEGKYGFLNKKGKWVVEPQFMQASDFNNGYAPALSGELWGLIDEKGEWAIVPKYNQLFWANDNYWIAELNEVYHLINENDYTISADFDEIHPFNNHLAPFRKGDLWGYINTDAKIVIPPIFYLAWPFNDGYARVATAEGLTYIDTLGFFLIPITPAYIEIRDFSEGLAPVQVYRVTGKS